MNGKTHKTKLNEYFQKNRQPPPIYASEYKGPDNNREFRAILNINDKEIYSEWCNTKKKAEEMCAANAYKLLVRDERTQKQELYELEKQRHQQHQQLNLSPTSPSSPPFTTSNTTTTTTTTSSPSAPPSPMLISRNLSNISTVSTSTYISSASSSTTSTPTKIFAPRTPTKQPKPIPINFNEKELIDQMDELELVEYKLMLQLEENENLNSKYVTDELLALKKQMLQLQIKINKIERVAGNINTPVVKYIDFDSNDEDITEEEEEEDDDVDDIGSYVNRTNKNTIKNNNKIIPEMLINKPRDYQIELYKEAMKSNIICCLPTGLGKTLIACMVIKKMKELNPTKRIIFMVERIPLLIQQSQVIKNETGLTVTSIYGETFKRTQLYRKFDVLVIIDAVLIKLIKSKDIDLNNYCLVVIDESHHIVKEHPFSVLIRNHIYSEESGIPVANYPKLLGLTASPAGKKDILSTVLSLKLMTKISSCELIKPKRSLIASYLNQNNCHIIPIPHNNLERTSLKFYKDLTKCFKIDINSNQNVYETCSEFIDVEYTGDDDRVGGGINNGGLSYDDQYNKSNQVAKFIQSYFEKINEYTTLNVINGQSILGLYLREFMEKEIELITDESIKTRILELITSIPTDEKIEKNNSKLDYALSVLQEKNNVNLKAIIFVKTRKCAIALLDILTKLASSVDQFSFIRARLVIGHGDGQDDGMTTTSQKRAIKEFRENDCNVIVATSVVEEGFDVPECNLVIRLDPPSTVIANIQSRGRLRNVDSHFYGIVKDNNPLENQIYEKFASQEIYLNSAIDFLKSSNGNTSSSCSDDVDEDESLLEIAKKTYVPVNGLTKYHEVCEIISRINSIGFELTLEWFSDRVGGDDHFPTYKSTARITSPCGIDIKYEALANSKKISKENVCVNILQSQILFHIIKDLK